jgi:hypothetical protein
MLGFVSETAITYRSSAIVKDSGGDGELRAGDRMPDLTLQNSGRGASLLENWTEANHLAVLVNASESDMAEVRGRLPRVKLVGVSTRDLDEAGSRALGADPKLLLVRPDGYIGFRGAVVPNGAWLEYAEQDGIVPMRSAIHA